MLTPDQIKQIAASRGDTVVNSPSVQASDGNPAAEFAKSVGYTPAEVPEAPKAGFFDRVSGEINKRGANIVDVADESRTGEISKPSAILQVAGQGAGAVADVTMEGLKSVDEKLHLGVGKTLTSLIQRSLEHDSITGDEIHTEKAKEVQQKVKEFIDGHPEAAKNMEAIFNIAGLIPAVGGAEEGVNFAAKGVKEIIEKGKEIPGKIIDAASELPGKAKAVVGDTVEKAQLAATKGNQIPTLESAAQKGIPVPGDTQIKDPLARYDEHVTMAQNALKDAKADTPLGQVGSSIGNAFDKVVQQRRDAGGKMAAELEKIGEKPTDISEGITNFNGELSKNGVALDAETGEMMRSKTSKLTESDKSLLGSYASDLHSLGPNPTIAELDAFLSRAPEELKVYKAKNNITGVTNGERIIKNNLTQLRSQFDPVKTKKGYLKDYAGARKQYADLSKFLDEGIPFLGKKMSSGDYAKDASIAKSSVQSVLNGGKKDWLLQLEALTGYPAIDDATLAVQAMKDAGDYRGASLLESLTKGATQGDLPHVPTTGTGIINAAIGKMLTGGAQKFTGTPVEQTRRYLQSLRKK